ncbi:MAG: ThuA domain-containing protein [Verrucomicrobiales bacterium]
MKSLSLFIVLSFMAAALAKAEPIRVLVWDERQKRQEEAYDDFLGNEIAKHLKAAGEDLEVRSVAMDDPGQGLNDLEWADVLIWWGHVRQGDVTEENVKRVMDRILSGDLDMIALHSAHFSSPFMEAMNWRSIEDAKNHFAKTDHGKLMKFKTVPPPKLRTVPSHGSDLTPSSFAYKLNKTTYEAIVHLPYCCFPAYRPDGEPSKMTVKYAKHPIAKGLPATFQVTQTEMYDEPFHVPAPDEVIFEETWELGERFRAGMVWDIGKGKVFYFRPGHETYPVFRQPEVIQVLTNACLWLGKE